jgi:uncharacterized protein (TIGR03083 family)
MGRKTRAGAVGAGGTVSTAGVADLARSREAIRVVTDRLAGMLRNMPEGDVPLRNSKWTVCQAAAHVAESQQFFGEVLLKGIRSPYGDGSCSLDDFAPVNFEQLKALSQRDGAKLAGLIEERTSVYLDASTRFAEDQRFRIHYGTMDLATLTSYVLEHLLMHATPIALALGRPLPVDRAHVELTLRFIEHIIPWLYDDYLRQGGRGPEATLEVHLRGGRRFAIRFQRSTVTVEDPPTGRADCHLSADPVAFFLVAVGIIPQWGAISRGQLLAWGRRPWLALRLKTLLPNP